MLCSGVIVLQKEPISPESEMKFRRWLAQSEAQTLRKVAAAQCQFLQAEALGKALTATNNDPSDLLCRDEMKEAARWADFITLFDRLAETAQFHIAKLQPFIPTNYAKPTENDGNAEP